MLGLWVMCERKLGVWLSLGGFHERGENWETENRIYNSHVIINDQGNVCIRHGLLK